MEDGRALVGFRWGLLQPGRAADGADGQRNEPFHVVHRGPSVSLEAGQSMASFSGGRVALVILVTAEMSLVQ